MAEVIEIASKVSTPLALGGLVAAFFFFILRQIVARNIFPTLTKNLGAGILRLIIDRLFVLALVAVVLGFAGFVVSTVSGKPPELYRVRVTVIDAEQKPVEDAKVWSSMGGEPKKVAGGWQFDIPAVSKPVEGKLTLFAELRNAFQKGRKELDLAEDYNPTVVIPLEKDTSAAIRGMVVDPSGRAVSGVRVSVVGYGSEAATTDEDGSFELAAHASPGQQVQLHAEKEGFEPTNQWHPAGHSPVTITLDPKTIVGGRVGRRN